ncbi:MAG: HAD family phosphatase [Endomicrobiia bacterium]
MKRIPFENCKAIFFDFDGVIANTEWLHFRAFNQVLKNFNINVSKKEYLKEYLAYDDKGCFKKVFLIKQNKEISKAQIKKLIKQKNRILMKQLKTNGFEFFPDTLKFINNIKKLYNIQLCIVSGALKQEILYILKKLKIQKMFSIIVSAEDVKNGKPSPEPYIVAKNKLEKKLNKKIKNEQIYVIEDSINGINAAKAAGFITIGVAHTYSLKKLKTVHPDFLVKNLADIKLTHN